MMLFGMYFQEYHVSWQSIANVSRNLPSYKQGLFLRTIWLVGTTFMIQFYCSILKASFIIKHYEDEITTLDEMVNR